MRKWGVVCLVCVLLPNVGWAKGQCHKAYSDMLRDHQLNILVVFGYKDSRPLRFVADRHEKIILVQDLLKPCESENEMVCGFSRPDHDAELFSRVISLRDRPFVTVNLRILSSSVSPDDKDNRTNPFQAWSSHNASYQFTRAIKTADIVFYNGHSRNGGGPDFHPPKILKNKQVDFRYYKKRRPGLRRIEKRLANVSESNMRLLGLFSCASSKHFVKRIMAGGRNLGIISSPHLLYHSDALSNTKSALSSVLKGHCRKQMKKVLRSPMPFSGSQIFGFK